MRLNSNTVTLEKESHEKIEEIIKKIASENKIENVSGVQIKLSKENGIVKFAIIDDCADYDEEGKEIRYTQDTEEEDEDEFQYEFRITYQIVTPESAEAGEYEEQGWELPSGRADDIDDLINQLENYGFSNDDRPDSSDELTFSTATPVEDRTHFEDEGDTYYTVFIEREDGKDFEQQEADTIKQRLGVQ